MNAPPERESRPLGRTGPHKIIAGERQSQSTDALGQNPAYAAVVDELSRRRRRDYARAMIKAGRQAGDLPRYGDSRWNALPTNDPRRIGAILVSAECWAEH